MTEFVYPVRCEWADCDPAGIWYYPTLFRWIDSAVHHLMHEIGVQPEVLADAGGEFGLPVVEAYARFLAPARYYDAAEVRGVVTELGARRFRLAYRVVRPRPEGEPELLATAYEVRVCVTKDGRGGIRARELPAKVRTGLMPFLAPEGSAPNG